MNKDPKHPKNTPRKAEPFGSPARIKELIEMQERINARFKREAEEAEARRKALHGK